MTTTTKCPTPWKQAHYNRTEAGRHLRKLRRRWGSMAKAQRTYPCVCGRWHVGGDMIGRRRR